MEKCYNCKVNKPETAHCPDCDQIICDECIEQHELECEGELDETDRLANNIVEELKHSPNTRLNKLIKEFLFNMWDRSEIVFTKESQKTLGMLVEVD